MNEIYRMVSVALGEPPKKFDLEYRDDDKKYHLERDLTPQALSKSISRALISMIMLLCPTSLIMNTTKFTICHFMIMLLVVIKLSI